MSRFIGGAIEKAFQNIFVKGPNEKKMTKMGRKSGGFCSLTPEEQALSVKDPGPGSQVRPCQCWLEHGRFSWFPLFW